MTSDTSDLRSIASPAAARALLPLVLGVLACARTSAPPAAPAAEAPTASSPAEMIVWLTTPDEAAARAEMERLQGELPLLGEHYEISATLEESAAVGLAPGSWVVGLGVCSAEELAGPLELLQQIFPDVSTLTVAQADAWGHAPCPTPGAVTSDDNGEPVLWHLTHSVDMYGDGYGLRALVFAYDWSQLGDFARQFYGVRMLVVLLDGAGRPKQMQVYAGPSDATTATALRDTGGSIVLDLDYADPPCDPSGDQFVSWKGSVVVTGAAGGIQIAPDEPIEQSSGPCGYAEESRWISGEGYEAEEAPAEDAPAEDAPAEDAPAEDAPADDASPEDGASGDEPSGD